MSQLIPKDQLLKGGFAVLLDSGALFDLHVLQATFEHTNLASTKAWCSRHGVRPIATGGNNWLFDTDSVREQLKAHAKESQQC